MTAPDVETGLPIARGATRLPRMRLGEMLLQRGLIEEEDLERALARQEQTGERLGEILVAIGAIDSVALHRALADSLGVAFVDLHETPVDPATAALLPEEWARRYRALPVCEQEGGRVLVALADVTNIFALDDLQLMLGRPIDAALVAPDQLEEAFRRHHSYGRDLDGDTDVRESVDEIEFLQQLVTAEDSPVVRYVDDLIAEAVARRGSDLHLEPHGAGMRVRVRVDGVLRELPRPSGIARGQIVSRVKILAGMDIAQRRLPQDGRFTMEVTGRRVDVRAATLPTGEGETVALRLLDASAGVITLEELGLPDDLVSTYERLYRRPHGAVLVTGPTGSGKTTTLYATLAEVNDAERNLLTVEDPIEYRMDGVKQMQINRAAGLTFPIALRSILRADPDVLLVGEIRDPETARISIEAALTGHLVFASIHANDAGSTPARLIEMGVEPYLVASALRGIVAQRLARKLCQRCRVEDPRSRKELAGYGWPEDLLGDADEVMLYRSAGCPACDHSGYAGRIPIFEILEMSDPIERAIAERAAAKKIQKLAIGDGMVTLFARAARMAHDGLLSLTELLRVVAG